MQIVCLLDCEWESTATNHDQLQLYTWPTHYQDCPNKKNVDLLPEGNTLRTIQWGSFPLPSEACLKITNALFDEVKDLQARVVSNIEYIRVISIAWYSTPWPFGWRKGYPSIHQPTDGKRTLPGLSSWEYLTPAIPCLILETLTPCGAYKIDNKDL